MSQRFTPKSAPRVTDERDRALYVISVAAELAGVHPQTLRMYERKGLLAPRRTDGNSRRYSARDIERIRLIQSLTQERGLNLAAVEIVITLQKDLESSQRELEHLQQEMESTRAALEDQMRKVSKAEMVLMRDIVDFFGRDEDAV
ncbi:MAG: heat shock protein transcriptional repressor HspR [Actinomycetota bacterium]